jgi:hypothetical protein
VLMPPSPAQTLQAKRGGQVHGGAVHGRARSCGHEGTGRSLAAFCHSDRGSSPTSQLQLVQAGANSRDVAHGAARCLVHCCAQSRSALGS